MNNLLLLVFLLFSVNTFALYNNGFDTPPYLLPSDYAENIIDSITHPPTAVSPSPCDVRAASNPDEILEGTACVFDFLQIYSDNVDVIQITINNNQSDLYLFDENNSTEWLDLERFYEYDTPLLPPLCIGDMIEITSWYYDDNGNLQTCTKSLELVCCQTNTSIEYGVYEDTAPSGSDNTVLFKAYGYNGLPAYIKRPKKPDYSTCNNFTSQWCIFEANSPDGNFVLIGFSPQQEGITIPIDKHKYYHILNKSSTPCSDECFLITVHPNPFNPDQPLVTVTEDFDCPDETSCTPTLSPDAICTPVFNPRIEYSLLTDFDGSTTTVICYYLDLVELNLPGASDYDYDIYVNGAHRLDNLICCGEDCDWENLTINVEIDGCDPYTLSLEEITGIFVDPNEFRTNGSVETAMKTFTKGRIANSTLVFDIDKAQTASLIIYDMGGKIVQVLNNLPIQEGRNSIPLGLQDISHKGMYFISLYGETFQLSEKYIHK